MENPKEIEQIKDMNIHEKLMNIKFELLDVTIKKSGHNDYGKFDYHELKDLIPPIIKLCKKYRCITHTTFEENIGKLFLINVDNPKDYLYTEATRPDLHELPRMNIMQSEGSYETYMRRYLVLNMFDIVEPDTIDNTEIISKQDTKYRKTSQQSKKISVPKPLVLEKVFEEIKKQKPELDNPTKKDINSVSFKMFQNNKITKDDRKQIMDYLKTI